MSASVSGGPAAPPAPMRPAAHPAGPVRAARGPGRVGKDGAGDTSRDGEQHPGPRRSAWHRETLARATRAGSGDNRRDSRAEHSWAYLIVSTGGWHPLAESMSVTTSPFDDHVGVVVVSATPEKVVATLDIDPARHTQPYGVVHGGVYATMAETVASIGSFLVAHQFGRVTMGLEKHTS